jgi:hypothetical protein
MTTMVQGNEPAKWSTVTMLNFGTATAGSRNSKAVQNSMKQQASPASRTLDAIAVDALQNAREMPAGAQRAKALKQAGLLRRVADSHGLILAKRGRPRK